MVNPSGMKGLKDKIITNPNPCSPSTEIYLATLMTTNNYVQSFQLLVCVGLASVNFYDIKK